MNKITLGFFSTKSKTTIKGLLGLFVMLLMNTQVSWGQGTLSNPIFSENFGTLADAVSLTTSNSAFSYIRVGTSTTANSIVNRIITKNPSSFTGSSALIGAKGGSVSTVDKTGLTSFASGTLTFKFKTPGSLDSAVMVSAVGTGASFGSATGFTGAQLSAGFQVTGTNLKIRANGNWTTVQTVAVSTLYTVTLVFNNTAGSLSYGDDKNLAANKCHIWVDGVYVGEYSAATNNLAASAFRIYTTTSEFEVDDVAVYNTLPAISSTTWNGTSWSNGAPTASLDAIIAGAYSAAANITAKTLTVNNSAVATIPTGNNVTVTGAVTVTAPSTLTFSNNANLIQDAATTVNANSGAITVIRDSNALYRLDYTMWSSPVDSQNLLAFSPLTNATRFYTYNPSTNLYNTVVSPSTTPFAAANGYLIRMPNEDPSNLGGGSAYALGTATLTYDGAFTGLPNNGDVSVTGLASNTYNAVGNPYPSTISADAFINGNSTDGTLYFWRKTNAGTGTAYATYNLVGITVTAAASGNGSGVPDGTVAVGQGFIVKTGVAATTLDFTNAMRTTNNSAPFFKTRNTVERNRVWVNLTNTTGVFSQMLVAYMTDATQGVDAGIDGKYINDSAIALNSFLNNEEFVIQGRSLPFDGTDVVPLAFKTDLAGEYTIAIDHVDGLFSGSQAVFLKDNSTGIETDLKAGAYAFTAAAGVDNARFSLKYQKTLGINASVFNDNSVAVYKNKGTIHIKSSGSTIDNVKIYDISGRLIFEKSKVNANDTTIESAKLGNQVLIVEITSENQIKVSKKLVN